MNPEMVLVCDVDDTICFTTARDYAKSIANVPVIEKLRKAKELGYSIVLHTARGQGRSNGNVASVEEEVKAEIEAMCIKFDVPFDEIVLGKVWAKYYIDDKALRPSEFVSVEL